MTPHTIASLYTRVDTQWSVKTMKTDWLGLEQLLVDILNSTIEDDMKVVLSKQAINAYTRRGHFA